MPPFRYKRFMSDQPHKKRVVFVLPRLYPGGAERVLITLMNNTPRDIYDVQFISLSGEGTIKHWIDSDIPIHSLHKTRVSASLVGLYKKLKELKPDTIMTTMIHTNAGVLLLKPFFPKTRFIIRESSLPMALINEYGLKGKFSKYVYKFLYPRADAVIIPARAITREFKDDLKINVSNHVMLHNPVNERRLHSTISEFSDEPDRGGVVKFVCVGRLGYEKGYDRLIKALEGFQLDHGLNWKLDIIGKGSETKNLGDLIRACHLSDHIHLAGYQNTPWPQMAEADCLLLPSRWEGMPNVVLEALACGTTVIAHKEAGGVCEIAELAAENDVRIASDMNEFIAMMRDVRPSLPEAKLPVRSRLPREFALQNVMKNFQAIL